MESIKNDLRFINRALNCERCLLLLKLDVERYGGRDTNLISLDLSWNDVFEGLAYDEFNDYEGLRCGGRVRGLRTTLLETIGIQAMTLSDLSEIG